MSPTTATTLTVADESGTTPTTDDRQYTVTGLDNTKSYTVALLPSANVTVSTGGVVTFADVGDDSLADGIADSATGAANISGVNGAANSDDRVAVTPVSGTITFTVDGDLDGTIRPVVFQDADADTNLDLNSSNAPTEPFGIGGSINYNPAEAATAAVTPDAVITEVDRTANNFVAGSFYEYDASDLYYIDNDGGDTADVDEQVTMAEFEAQLSAGDELSVGSTYNANPAFVSTFLLEDLAPSVPTALTAASTTATGTTLTITGPATDGTATVKVYRGLDPAATFATSTVVATTATDASSTTAGFQVVISGLSASTTYEFWVTQTVDGEESSQRPTTAADGTQVTTTAVTETVAPTVTNTAIVSDTAPAGLLTDGDTFVMDFSEAMATTAGTLSTSFVRVADSDSVYQLTGAFALSDGPSSAGINDRLLVTLIDDNAHLDFISGTDNDIDMAGSTATVTLVSNDFDDVAGNQVSLGTSADVIVNDEGTVDAASPYITAADTTTDVVDGTWSQATDVLTLTFSEAVTFDDTTFTNGEDAALNAILGGSTVVDLAATSVVTVGGSGTDTITLTISGATLTAGLAAAATTDGTVNVNVQDLANNSQIANPGAAPVVS